MDLSQYRVPNSDAVYYIPNFVTEHEEEYLIRKIQESPQPRWKQLANRRLQIWGGTLTTKGHLIPQDIPSFVTQYPDIIGRIRATGAFSSSPHGAPNHIIMNEYLPGQGIMPHQDGPAYHPVVATLSLGSAAMFHYYRYADDVPDDPTAPTAPPSTNGNGRAIHRTPIHSLLLEPRSLVITTSSLYNSHLHGIEWITEDKFQPQSAANPPAVDNFNLLTGKAERETILRGGVLERQTRYSLTCRDVEKVANGLPGLLKR